MRLTKKITVCLGILLLVSPVFAQRKEYIRQILTKRPETNHGYPLGYTKAEFLPAWCDCTMDGAVKDRTIIESYFDYFGDGFRTLHHYCRGLFNAEECLPSAETANSERRLYRCQLAVQEYGFVLTNTDASFRLRPEILVRSAVASMAQDRGIEAVKFLTEAIELSPDYAPSYVVLSNYFERMGETAEARRVLMDGVKNAPRAEILREKLASLQASLE